MTPVVLRWTPTHADLADAHAALRRRPMRPAVRYGAAAAFLLCAAVLLLLDRLDLALFFAVLAVPFVLLGRKPVDPRSGGRVLASRKAYTPTEAVVDAAGLRVGAESRPWSDYTRTVETELSFVLLGPRARAGLPLLTYLPKRAAPDVDQLRTLLAEAVTPPLTAVGQG